MILAMEPPVSFDADEVRDEKAKVLHAIPRARRRGRAEDGGARAVRGAAPIGGEEVPGYLEEEDVPEDSTTETFAAVRLHINNWRWAGVPFYLRTGKRLARKTTEIAVTLKPVPHLAFQQSGLARRAAEPADPRACSRTRACRCRSWRRSPARG